MKKILVFGLALAFSVPQIVTGQKKMNEKELKAIVQNFYEALSTTPTKENTATIAKWMSPTWISTPTPPGGAELEGFVKTLYMFHGMIPDLKWEIQEMIISGNRVIVRSIASGTPNSPEGYFFGTPTDGSKKFEVQTIDIHTVQNGKMVKSFHNEDWLTAVGQVSPTPVPDRTKLENSQAYPEGGAIVGDFLYMTEFMSGRVFKQDIYTSKESTIIAGDGSLSGWGIGKEVENNMIYVCQNAPMTEIGKFLQNGEKPTTIGRLIAIDTNSDEIQGTWNLPSGVFGNGVAVAENGMIYITDLGGKLVSVDTKGNTVTPVLEGAPTGGICYVGDNTFYAHGQDKINRITIDANGKANMQSLTVMGEKMSNSDGLAAWDADTLFSTKDGASVLKLEIAGDAVFASTMIATEENVGPTSIDVGTINGVPYLLVVDGQIISMFQKKAPRQPFSPLLKKLN